jgi:protein-S-isoprenylcysteine O-methyltransferase Ste14
LTHHRRFRIALFAVMATYTAIRLQFIAQVRSKAADVQASEESVMTDRLMNTLAVASNIASAVYILAPARMDWASVALPHWVRWVGLPIGVAGALLLHASHRALGLHWSGALQIRKGHRIVDAGPYRRIRHPMYTTAFAWALSSMLLTGNAVIGGLGLVFATLLARRTQKEERMMGHAFGDEYRTYQERTWRFFPGV